MVVCGEQGSSRQGGREVPRYVDTSCCIVLIAIGAADVFENFLSRVGEINQPGSSYSHAHGSLTSPILFLFSTRRCI